MNFKYLILIVALFGVVSFSQNVPEEECVCEGPAPLAPNVECKDGTVGGPVCEATENGKCEWKIVECIDYCKECDEKKYTCELNEVVCVKAPCPPEVKCIPKEEEKECTADECGPAIEVAERECKDGSTAGPVCDRENEDRKCKWRVTECPEDRITCANVDCRDGYYCSDTKDGPICHLPCQVGGCSGQLCGKWGEDLISTCEWREEYECYQKESIECGLNEDGRCTWQPKEKLEECLSQFKECPDKCVWGCDENGECNSGITCATVLCVQGSICEDTKDGPVCKPSCDATECKDGYKCELQKVECITEPCYPQPICVPKEVVSCDTIKCASGECVDTQFGGFCKPTCRNIECEDDEICILQEVQCITHPCFPQPTCVDKNYWCKDGDIGLDANENTILDCVKIICNDDGTITRDDSDCKEEKPVYCKLDKWEMREGDYQDLVDGDVCYRVKCTKDGLTKIKRKCYQCKNVDGDLVDDSEERKWDNGCGSDSCRDGIWYPNKKDCKPEERPCTKFTITFRATDLNLERALEYLLKLLANGVEITDFEFNQNDDGTYTLSLCIKDISGQNRDDKQLESDIENAAKNEQNNQLELVSIEPETTSSKDQSESSAVTLISSFVLLLSAIFF